MRPWRHHRRCSNFYLFNLAGCYKYDPKLLHVSNKRFTCIKQKMSSRSIRRDDFLKIMDIVVGTGSNNPRMRPSVSSGAISKSCLQSVLTRKSSAWGERDLVGSFPSARCVPHLLQQLHPYNGTPLAAGKDSDQVAERYTRFRSNLCKIGRLFVFKLGLLTDPLRRPPPPARPLLQQAQVAASFVAMGVGKPSKVQKKTARIPYCRSALSTSLAARSPRDARDAVVLLRGPS